MGGMGVDVLNNLKFLNKSELEKILKIKFNKKNFLIIFHPTTLETGTAKKQFNNILFQ